MEEGQVDEWTALNSGWALEKSAGEGSWKQKREGVEGEEQKEMDSWMCEGSVNGGLWLMANSVLGVKVVDQ